MGNKQVVAVARIETTMTHKELFDWFGGSPRETLDTDLITWAQCMGGTYIKFKNYEKYLNDNKPIQFNRLRIFKGHAYVPDLLEIRAENRNIINNFLTFEYFEVVKDVNERIIEIRVHDALEERERLMRRYGDIVEVSLIEI